MILPQIPQSARKETHIVQTFGGFGIWLEFSKLFFPQFKHCLHVHITLKIQPYWGINFLEKRFPYNLNAKIQQQPLHTQPDWNCKARWTIKISTNAIHDICQCNSIQLTADCIISRCKQQIINSIIIPISTVDSQYPWLNAKQQDTVNKAHNKTNKMYTKNN